jgi:Ca2+-binding RTX toxin-like protein
MAGFSRLTSEILVNSTITRGQFQPAIALQSSGNIMVTWTDFSALQYDIQAQIFSPTGVRIGSQIEVTTDDYQQELSSVSALANGNYLVTWTDNSLRFGLSSQNDIFGKVYSSTGTEVGSAFQISPTNYHYNTYSDTTTLTNGNFVVAWFDQSSLTLPIDYHSMFKIYQADGTPVTSVITFEPLAIKSLKPTITSLANGQFVIVGSLQTSTDSGLFGQIYNADGSLSGSDFKISTTPGGNVGTNQSHVTQLANGQMVVCWYTYAQGALIVLGQIIGVDGSKVGGEFLVGSDSSGVPGQPMPDVTALADGRFIVSWTTWFGGLGDTSNAGLHAQIYLPNGERSGSEFLVNVNTLNAQSNSQVVAMSDGKFAITYVDDSSLPAPDSGSDVRLQIFDPTNYVVSDSGENYTGGSLADTIVSGIAADVLNGGDGNDTMIISGTNTGRDVIDGGIGTDTLDLSAFTGTVWVDYAFQGDDVWTFSGAAWKRVADLTSIETLLGTSGDDQVYGDGNANGISGGGGADFIVGRAGNDVLNGNDGNDRLYGDDGNDTLSGGNGTDELYGGNNDDTFLFSGAGNAGRDYTDGGSGGDTADFSGLTGTAWVDLTLTGYEAWTNTGSWSVVSQLLSVENIIGSAGSDQIYGDVNANVISGGNGNDFIVGRAGNDVLNGDGGNDRLYGDDGNDVLAGGLGTDELYGGNNDDTFLFANNGGTDWTEGGSGNDTADFSGLSTYAWVDLSLTGYEAWSFNGSWNLVSQLSSVENIIGSALNDQLWGDAQNNVFIGGAGSDRLTGRGGADTFKYTANNFGQDVVMDYVDGTDRLSFGSIVATDISNFTITGQGTNQVYMVLTSDPTSTITLNGLAPITISNADIDFFV